MSGRAAGVVLAAMISAAAANGAGAIELTLPPTARQTLSEQSDLDRYAAPVGVWQDGALPVAEIEGAVSRRAWVLSGGALTPLQILAPLRAQLEAEGYRIALDCAGPQCGGFDFRFATEVLPAPEMFVNLRRFHALTALRGPAAAPEAALTLIASTRSGAAHLQMIEATRSEAPQGVTAVARAPTAASDATLAARLEGQGHAVLDGLDFGVGTAALGAGPFASVAALAEVLNARPELRVALVGHTDATGDLETNIDLSRARALAVRSRLVEAYGIAADRLTARGVGYLSPLTTNATPEGREANRRVEAVALVE